MDGVLDGGEEKSCVTYCWSTLEWETERLPREWRAVLATGPGAFLKKGGEVVLGVAEGVGLELEGADDGLAGCKELEGVKLDADFIPATRSDS